MSAYVKAPEEFLEILDKLFFDETSLCWKWTPEKSFIRKETKSMPGLEAFKDRISFAWEARLQATNKTLRDLAQ